MQEDKRYGEKLHRRNLTICELFDRLNRNWGKQLARYYFHFLDSRNVRDDVGSEHADVDGVRTEAVEVLAELLRGSLLADEDMSNVMVQVTDEDNATVLIISLLAAVQVVDAPS